MLAHYYSNHAEKRLQQRGITDLEVELILMYGSETHHGDGCVYSRIDRNSFRRLEKDLKRVNQKIESLKKKFVVISDACTVVTTGHEYRHANRK
jgi:ATP sulfurylase